MTKKELLKVLELYDDDACVVCMDASGGWDNIEEVRDSGGLIAIVFGGGSPFTSDN